MELKKLHVSVASESCACGGAYLFIMVFSVLRSLLSIILQSFTCLFGILKKKYQIRTVPYAETDCRFDYCALNNEFDSSHLFTFCPVISISLAEGTNTF